MKSTNRVARAWGFTLIEVAVATAIIGVSVATLLMCVGVGTRLNDDGQKLAQAAFLANEIREWTSNLPFCDPNPAFAALPPGPEPGNNPQTTVTDLDDLMNVTYSPPRDGRGSAIAGMSDWSETLTLTWRDPANLSVALAVPAAASSGNIINVQVQVYYRGSLLFTGNYLASRRS
jgi:prepilin-type N-terminal cleavage/methylation domain-containing protein